MSEMCESRELYTYSRGRMSPESSKTVSDN